MVSWGRVALAGVGLLVLCVAGATGLGYAVNHWVLGRDLWFVVDLVLGLLFGVPVFGVLFVWLVRRWRRPRMLERRRFLE